MSTDTDVRGFTLLSVLLALAVAAALMVAGAFFVRSETRLSESEGHEAQAAGAAEYGAVMTLDSWTDGWDTLAPVTIPDRPTPGSTGRYSGSVYRLQEGVFLVDITGTSGAARSRVGLLVEVPTPFPDTSHLFDGAASDVGVLVVSGSGTAQYHDIGSVATFMRANGDSSMSISTSKAIVDSALRDIRRARSIGSRSWIRLF